jgi:uncharacterized lipoprotein NlpE involved in copper resistance
MSEKIFIIFLLTAVLTAFGSISCATNKGIDTEHNSRSCLDWDGVYTGTFPSDSGADIAVRLKLNSDQSFELRYDYQDRPDGPIIFPGLSFIWDDTGRIITIDIIDAPTYYKVEQNRLVEVDENGKRILGKLPDHYILKKEL